MKKRILSIILAIAMLASMIPTGMVTVSASAVDYAESGTGEAADPYIIKTGAQLNALAAKVYSDSNFSAGKYFKLSDDFNNEGAKLTTPIGQTSSPFRGYFDGNGRTVHLNITGNGMFEVASNDQNKDGFYTTIANVRTEGTVSASTPDAGGVCGALYADCFIINCHNNATVTSSNIDVGGVCGNNAGTIRNCGNTASVSITTSKVAAGGVCGLNSYGMLLNCYNTGSVSTKASYVGGVSGKNVGGTVQNCYNAGSVSTSVTAAGPLQYVGAIIGSNQNGGTIEDCFGKAGCTTGTANFGTTISDTDMKLTSGDNALVTKLNNKVPTYVGYYYWAVTTGVNSGYPYIMTPWAQLGDAMTGKITTSVDGLFTISGGTIKLLTYFTAASSETALWVGGTKTLDLNGFTINLNAKLTESEKGSVIVVDKGTLTVQDSSAKETGTITGGFGYNAGGIKIQNSGTATLKSGTISGNYGTLGAGVRVDSGCTFNMCGGTIKDNISQWGGGISNSGTINMTAGEITDNIGTQGAAGIFMDGGNATITGGKITGNKAAGQSPDEKGDQYSGGIKLKSNASLTVGGTAVISGNYGMCGLSNGGNTKVWNYTGLSGEGIPGNLRLCSGAKVAIATGDNAPKDGMKVGVSVTDSNGAFTNGVFTTATATAGQEKYFFADAEGKVVVFENNTLKIKNDGITSWSDLQDAINAAGSEQTVITLTRDLTASSSDAGIVIPSGKDIVLDLNGKTLSRNLSTAVNNGYVIGLKGKLTIQDSTAYTDESGNYISGKITGGKNKQAGGGVAAIADGCTLIMHGGSVTNCTSCDGGALFCKNYATIIMDGGTIHHNTVTGTGGGIAVCSYSTVTVSGGEIYSNTSTSTETKEYGGGAIGVWSDCIINISGDTKIYDNKANLGGAIELVNQSKLNVQGGSIFGNEATVTGGAVNSRTYDDCITITGGSITDNISAGTGGGLNCNSETIVTLGGTAVITGNKTGDVENNVYLPSGTNIIIATGDNAPKDGMNVGVTKAADNGLGVFTTATATAGQEDYFFADAEGKVVVFANNTLKIKKDSITSWSDLQDAINDAGSEQTVITLTQDLTASSSDAGIQIPKGKDIVLDLNGKTLNANAIQNGAIAYELRAITVSGKLTVQDSSDQETGTITGGYAYNGGGIYINGNATLTLKSGTISGNCGVLGGGVYVCSGATFNMEGGAVKDNYAKWGAGITNASGTVNVTAGQIINNQSSQGGSGINSDGGKLTITGGLFSGNKGGSVGSGANDGSCVRLNGSSTLTIGGTVVIRDNFTNCGTEGNNPNYPFVMGQGKTQGNLYIASNTAKVNIATGDNAPKDGMKVGVTMANGTGVFTTATATAGQEDYFFSDNPAYVSAYDNSALRLLTKIAAPTITGDKDNLFVYTGETITALESNEYYTVEGGSATEIGVYTAKVTPTGNYEWDDEDFDGEIEWEIISREEYNLINGNCEKNELMGRQGLIMGDGVVSDTIGRTIIPITQKQLESIGEYVWVVGFDGYKNVKVKVDCAYTWFYDDGVKIEAEGMTNAAGEAIVAFIIVDNDGTQNEDNTITGFGYYRVYCDEIVDDSTHFLFDALYAAPNAK